MGGVIWQNCHLLFFSATCTTPFVLADGVSVFRRQDLITGLHQPPSGRTSPPASRLSPSFSLPFLFGRRGKTQGWAKKSMAGVGRPGKGEMAGGGSLYRLGLVDGNCVAPPLSRHGIISLLSMLHSPP